MTCVALCPLAAGDRLLPTCVGRLARGGRTRGVLGVLGGLGFLGCPGALGALTGGVRAGARPAMSAK